MHYHPVKMAWNVDMRDLAKVDGHFKRTARDYLERNPDTSQASFEEYMHSFFSPYVIERHRADFFPDPHNVRSRNGRAAAADSPPAVFPRASSQDDDAAVGHDYASPSGHKDHTNRPILDSKTSPATIRTIMRHPMGVTYNGTMTVMTCHGDRNYISRQMLRNRNLEIFIDPESDDTLHMEWWADLENKIYVGGNSNLHRTRFDIIETMHVDVALCEDAKVRDDWGDAPSIPPPAAPIKARRASPRARRRRRRTSGSVRPRRDGGTTKALRRAKDRGVVRVPRVR